MLRERDLKVNDRVIGKTPKESILLTEGIYDLFAEAQPIEELWHKWQQPEIWRLPHGHISGLFAPGLMGRVLGWLAPRLEAGRKNSEARLTGIQAPPGASSLGST
jgi:hypothetical protein